MIAFRPDKPLGTVVTSSWIPRLIDYVERVTVVVTFAIYVWMNYDPDHWLSFAIACTDVVTVWFILIRRPANSVSPDPEDWLLALAGTLLGMMARPGGEPLVPGAIGFCLATQGVIITLAAKLSLARSFGLAPANRGVRMRGAYVFVRHPMYLGYAVSHAAYLLVNPTRLNFLLIATTWACQFGRVLREERWLMQDRAYRRYSRIVRFRIIPGLF